MFTPILIFPRRGGRDGRCYVIFASFWVNFSDSRILSELRGREKKLRICRSAWKSEISLTPLFQRGGRITSPFKKGERGGFFLMTRVSAVKSLLSIENPKSKIENSLMAAHALIPAAACEDLVEPRTAYLRIDLAIHDHRSAPLIEPRSQPFKISYVADRHSFGAHRRCDGGKVVVSEESPMSGQADVFQQMHLSAIGRIVDDDDERRNFITHESLELAETHHEPAIPRCANGQAIRVGDRSAKGRSQTQTDRHEVVGKNKAGGVGRGQVDDRPTHGVAAIDHNSSVARQHRIEFEHQCTGIDRVAVALILEVIEPK